MRFVSNINGVLILRPLAANTGMTASDTAPAKKSLLSIPAILIKNIVA